jgi:hypothetical protein
VVFLASNFLLFYNGFEEKFGIHFFSNLKCVFQANVLPLLCNQKKKKKKVKENK